MSPFRLFRPLAGVAATGALLLGWALPAAADPPAARPAGTPLPPDVAVAGGAPALPSDLSSSSWLVADLGSGHVLAAKAGSAQRAPASTQKILAALTFAPLIPPEVEASAADLQVTGSTAGLKAGVRYRSADLLDALFVSSGNDVAQVLARAAGDPATAPDRMTQTAHDLGATDTIAGDVTGLDAPGQLTTAYDLAVLTRAALGRPDLRHAAGLAQLTLTGSNGVPRRLSSTNPLLGHYPGAIGVKTGSTADAGHTFVGAAERDGRTLAVVLMDAPASFGREATALLDWGFRAAPGTAPIADLPTGTTPAAAPAAEPPSVPVGDGNGGISPLLALAIALTVVASAFTYWQGRERQGTGPPSSADEPVDPAYPEPADVADGPGQSSPRDSRSIFAP